MMFRRIGRHASNNGGFSMIEVLVALLILAVGLLGVAGVQMVAMQQAANSNLRTQVTLYAQDLAEQIRANGGDIPSDARLEAWNNRLQRDLGPETDMEVDIEDEVAVITIEWEERESFRNAPEEDEGGGEDSDPESEAAVQKFTLRASL